jgi:hypothetical protein
MEEKALMEPFNETQNDAQNETQNAPQNKPTDEALHEAADKAFASGTYKCVISNPFSTSEKYKKITMDFIDGYYHLEKYTETQVFHEKKTYDEAKRHIRDILGKA